MKSLTNFLNCGLKSGSAWNKSQPIEIELEIGMGINEQSVNINDAELPRRERGFYLPEISEMDKVPPPHFKRKQKN